MVYKRLPDNTPDILRKYGLKVVEVDGWKTRGRDASHGGFNPTGVLCHYTATDKNWTDKAVLNLLIKGRSDLPGPLVQFGLSRDGTVYLIASGRCNHAGDARASGTIVAGDGNELYIGIEAYNAGGNDPWPKVQYDAYVLLAAVLTKEITKNSVKTVRGHRETSKTGKPDPQFSMDEFRTNVAKKIEEISKTNSVPTPTPASDDTKPTVELKPLPSGLKRWSAYSGKPSGEMHLKDGDDWQPMDCVIKEAPPIAGSEFHMFYARVDFDWAPNSSGMAKVECKFVRADGDDTAYKEAHFEHGTKSVPFDQFHFEEGTKLKGRWYMKTHGGGANVTITTRYCKTHVIGV